MPERRELSGLSLGATRVGQYDFATAAANSSGARKEHHDGSGTHEHGHRLAAGVAGGGGDCAVADEHSTHEVGCRREFRRIGKMPGGGEESRAARRM